jgi:hypothetical protein
LLAHAEIVVKDQGADDDFADAPITEGPHESDIGAAAHKNVLPFAGRDAAARGGDDTVQERENDPRISAYRRAAKSVAPI